ncbi:MAG: hypothetical protein HOI47_19190, partial [Candidatus Scalindua sp.]|nr:hypothetical protein [Candidatus Scalindua sp.]
IGQPRYSVGCCCCPEGWIGNVKKATFNDNLDCALIEIDDDIADKVINSDNGSTENKIEGFDEDITGAALPLLHDDVKKYGRATGLTAGRIADIDFGPNQMLIEILDKKPVKPDEPDEPDEPDDSDNSNDFFARHGDSGAVILNEDLQVIGLLVSAFQETIIEKDDETGLTETKRLPLTKYIATRIKPVMADLDISIAGVSADQVVAPVIPQPWPGGQADRDFNPVETFTSADFELDGDVDWDVSRGVSGGAPGAVIIETGGETADGRSSISVRYDKVSASRKKKDAVSIKASRETDGVTVEFEKFRTVFTVTPRINTDATIDAKNSKKFDARGGIETQAGVGIPGTDGATLFIAKAEIIFDILPTGIQWDAIGTLSFPEGAASGEKGEIRSRRETKFTKGRQYSGKPNRKHTEKKTYGVTDGGFIDDVFQAPSTLAADAFFLLAHEGINPSDPDEDDPGGELLQGYDRADYIDYLEIHDGTNWIRISDYAEWFANLTAELNSEDNAPPVKGTPNTMDPGTTDEKIPNQPPVVTLVSDYRESKFGETVTLSATATDPDNDEVSIRWTRIDIDGDEPPVSLNSPTGDSVKFTAPDDDFQYKFKAVADDGTGEEEIARTAGNNLSSAAKMTVNVIEWTDKEGGNTGLCLNDEEVFNAANFGIGEGALNWDVTDAATGEPKALIVEKDGIAIPHSGTAIGATTIKVNYNKESASASIEDSVKIKATNPANGKSWFKRRTVTRTFAITTSVERIPEPLLRDMYPEYVEDFFDIENNEKNIEMGITEDHHITITICAYRSGANWKAALLTVKGYYSILVKLIGNEEEVTGPFGNTTEENYCQQINDLNTISKELDMGSPVVPAAPDTVSWVILDATVKHEEVHASTLKPALDAILEPLSIIVGELEVPHIDGMTQETAITAIQFLPEYLAALVEGRDLWDKEWADEFVGTIAHDHFLVLESEDPQADISSGSDNKRKGHAHAAELARGALMIATIREHALANVWAACPTDD